MRRALFILLIVAGLGSAESATVYRWVDDRGRLHFGDHQAGDAERIEVKPGSGISVDSGPASTARQEDCDRLRAQLEDYRRAGLVVETDALGHRHEYDAGQKARLIELSEQQVASACGHGS